MEHHFCVHDATPMWKAKHSAAFYPEYCWLAQIKAQIKFMHFKQDRLRDSNVIKSVVDLQLRNLLR